MKLQFAKLISGVVLALAFLAALAFEKALGGLDDTARVAIIGALGTCVAVALHGAYKLQPGEKP